MKLVCSRDRLREGLNIVGGALPLKTTKPVLETVLFEISPGSLRLLATDLEVAVRYEFPEVDVDTAGSFLLAAREATEFVRDLSDDTVTIEVTKNLVRIFGKEDVCELAVADVGEFPQMPEVTEAQEFTVPGAQLALQLERTVFAAARDIGRFAMNGVRLELGKDRVRFVATDGRRLSLVEQPLEEGVPEVSPVTIPTKAIQQIARVLQEDRAPVTVAIASDRASVRSSRATIVTRLLEGEFPRYQAVVPKEGKNVAECDPQLLAQKIRLVAHLTAPEQPIVRFQFSASSLVLSASSPQRGEARAEMPASFRGTQDQIAFNPEFVLDGLKVCGRESLRMEFNERGSPGKLHLNDNHEYVIMPVAVE
jgi:DNA polymerase III subunit beta